jgi:hypothetical protein
VKVPARKRDQLSLNSDHTHFIIIREQPLAPSFFNNIAKKAPTVDSREKQLEKLTDSADSATNRFRDKFEDFLHQEALQQPTNEPTIGTIKSFTLPNLCLGLYQAETIPRNSIRNTFSTVS